MIATRTRSRLRIRGAVQGVGFRPAVYRLALEQGVGGFVHNDGDGVTIEIEGEEQAVASFGRLLRTRAPAAARIDGIEVVPLDARGDEAFRVEPSAANGTRTEAAADRATCDACVGELFDPANRRHLYPFITCTNCGPRFTIIRELPYDRARTTMAKFAMCEACRAEYDDPLDRRFHSETNACAGCGPRLTEPLQRAIDALRAGAIVAVKGIGGVHLAVDASNEEAVARLRERKHRPDKPFAVMARDLAAAGRIACIDDPARAALTSPARPIVCLPARGGLVSSVAPRLGELGVMLPYTPLHHLLLASGPEVLVMTSGNRSDEPIAVDDDEARAQLEGIADLFLLHDRPIHARADDSVVRIVAAHAQPVRRGRGAVPESIALPFAAPPVLAVGAELKSTICLTRGDRAYLSPHIGDLSHPRSLECFEESIGAIRALLGVEPAAVGHDLHPDYASTRWALGSGLPRIGVQHHHAHIASCLAEHGRTGRVIGVAFDGTGCGPAGELWGGEFLVCDLGGFRRAGHIRAIALAGGEAAIREPWRLAVAALLDAGLPAPPSPIARMIERGLRAPRATSAGRWFDAVAALCGVRESITFEGQAAMELEAIAAPDGEAYPFEVTPTGELDLRPAIRVIALGQERPPIVSARFHETLAAGIAAVCEQVRAHDIVDTVALSGGCFQNRRLTDRTCEHLRRRGFEVLLHRRVPSNDGGIALGQAAVAAFRMRGGGE